MIDETYNEVWKLLNNIPLRDYLKIPKKEISEILKNKIPNYSDRKISEENIKAVSTEALKIYTRLYYNYIATKEEKNKASYFAWDLGQKLDKIEMNMIRSAYSLLILIIIYCGFSGLLAKQIKNKENEKIKNVKIVANLPYYITTPIIMKLLEEKLDIESITVMIQKEVADRLIEIPSGKNTGAITYTIYYYCDSEKIMEVPNSSFIPEPEVTSEVIKMKIRKEPVVKVENPKVMFMIIKSAFMQRRKTLINALNNAKIFQNKEEGNQILESLKLDESVRAEKLTLENFADITNRILKKYRFKIDMSQED